MEEIQEIAEDLRYILKSWEEETGLFSESLSTVARDMYLCTTKGYAELFIYLNSEKYPLSVEEFEEFWFSLEVEERSEFLDQYLYRKQSLSPLSETA